MSKKLTTVYLSSELVARERALGTKISPLFDEFLRQRAGINLDRTSLESRELQVIDKLNKNKIEKDILQAEFNEIQRLKSVKKPDKEMEAGTE